MRSHQVSIGFLSYVQNTGFHYFPNFVFFSQYLLVAHVIAKLFEIPVIQKMYEKFISKIA